MTEVAFSDIPKKCFLDEEVKDMSLVKGKVDFKILLNRDDFVFGKEKRGFCWLTGCKSDILQFKITNQQNSGKITKCKHSDKNEGFKVYYGGSYIGSIRAYYDVNVKTIHNFAVILFSEAESIKTYGCEDEECGWGFLGSFYVKANFLDETEDMIIYEHRPADGEESIELVNYPLNLYFGLYMKNESLGIASASDCFLSGKRIKLKEGGNVEYLIVDPDEYIMKYDAEVFINQALDIQDRYPGATKEVRGLFVSAIATSFSIIPRQLYYMDNTKRLNVTRDWLLGQLYFSIYLSGMEVDEFVKSLTIKKEESFNMMVIIRAFVYFMDNFTYVADNIKTGTSENSKIVYFEHFGGDIIPISGQYDCEDAAWFLQTCFEHLKDKINDNDPLLSGIASFLESYIPVSAIVKCKPPRIHFDFKMLGFRNDEVYYNTIQEKVGDTYYHMVCLLVPIDNFREIIHGSYENTDKKIYIADPCTMAYPDPLYDASHETSEETWEKIQQIVQFSLQPAFIPTTLNRGYVDNENGADQLYQEVYAFYTSGLFNETGTTEYIIHKGDQTIGVPFEYLLYPERRDQIRIDPNKKFYPDKINIEQYEKEDRTLEPPYPLLDLDLGQLKKEINRLGPQKRKETVWNSFFVKGSKEKLCYLNKRNSMYQQLFLSSIQLKYEHLKEIPLLGWNLTNQTKTCSVIPSYLISYDL